MTEQQPRKPKNEPIGNLITAAAIIYGAQYFKPMMGTEAAWMMPALILIAGYLGLAGIVQSLQFLHNQIRRYYARNYHTGSKGTSHWATEKQIKAAGLHRMDTKGVFLMLDAWGNPLCDNSNQHILIEAPTGAGKTSGPIIGTVFHCDLSTVCVDIKVEIYEATARAARKYQGKRTIAWDAFGLTGESSAYNPLLRVVALWESGDPEQHKEILAKIEEITVILLPEPDSTNSNDHFRQESMKWLVTTLAVMVTTLEFAKVTFTTLLETLSSPCELENMLMKGLATDALQGDVAKKSKVLLDQITKGDGERSGHEYTQSIRNGAATILEFARRSGPFAAATSHNDFQFSELKTSRVNIHLIVPPNQMQASKTCIELMQWAMMDEIVTIRNSKKFLAVFDEATFFKIPDIDFVLTCSRGFGMKAIICIQDHKEYARVYGSEHTLLSQTGVKLFMQAQSPTSMELVSKYSGEATVITPSYGLGNAWTDALQMQVSEQARPVLTGSEARLSDPVLIYPYVPPIGVQHIGYHEVMPWKRWQGASGFYGTKRKGKTRLVLRYRTLHHQPRHWMRTLCQPQQLLKEIYMATVKVIRTTGRKLHPLRLLKTLTGWIAKWTLRLLEAMLPLAPIAVILWLFVIAEETPHVLFNQAHLCSYIGMNGVVHLGGGDCPFIVMLP